MEEAGVPGVIAVGGSAYTPRATPKTVIARVHDEANQSAARPE
jgi:tripartite-type tricarboxylate transporter receptor subunit TctC